MGFMNCMMFDGIGGIGVWLSMGAFMIHRMLGLNRARHVDVLGGHVTYY